MSKVNRRLRTLYCGDFIDVLIFYDNVCIFRKRMAESKVENRRKNQLIQRREGSLLSSLVSNLK